MAIRVKVTKHAYTTYMTPLMGGEGITKLRTFPERGVGMFSPLKGRGDGVLAFKGMSRNILAATRKQSPAQATCEPGGRGKPQAFVWEKRPRSAETLTKIAFGEGQLAAEADALRRNRS